MEYGSGTDIRQRHSRALRGVQPHRRRINRPPGHLTTFDELLEPMAGYAADIDGLADGHLPPVEQEGSQRDVGVLAHTVTVALA